MTAGTICHLIKGTNASDDASITNALCFLEIKNVFRYAFFAKILDEYNGSNIEVIFK